MGTDEEGVLRHASCGIANFLIRDRMGDSHSRHSMLAFVLKLLSLNVCGRNWTPNCFSSICQIWNMVQYIDSNSGMQLLDNLSTNVRLSWAEVQIQRSKGCSRVKCIKSTHQMSMVWWLLHPILYDCVASINMISGPLSVSCYTAASFCDSRLHPLVIILSASFTSPEE